MANVLTAGNSSNGGTAISTDTSGTLNIVTGSGSGANAITIDASQNVVFSGNVSGNIKSGTAVASTSGTSIDFTGIPSTAKRITVMFSEVSTSGTSVPLVQLGDSGGVETTGYLTSVWQANTNNSNITTGFGLRATGQATAATVLSGHVVFTNLSGNIWVGSGVISRSDAADSSVLGGTKTTSAVLDRVRITTVNGTDAFDAGSINILFE